MEWRLNEYLKKSERRKKNEGEFERRLYYVGKIIDQKGFEEFKQIGDVVPNSQNTRKVSANFAGQLEQAELYTGAMIEETSQADPIFDMEKYLRIYPEERIKIMLPKMLGEDKEKIYRILSSEKKEDALRDIIEMIRKQSLKSPVKLPSGVVDTQEINLDYENINVSDDGKANLTNLIDVMFKAHSGVTRDFILKDIFAKADIVKTIIRDYALIVESTVNKRQGGIDFNVEHLELQERGDVFQFDVLPSMQIPNYPFEIQGIEPMIINITPVTNFPLLLGMKEESPPRGQLSKLAK